MEVTGRQMRLLAAAGFRPKLLREPAPGAPAIVAFQPAGEARMFALFPDELEPRYARVTTGMGFSEGEAPDPARLLRLANESNRCSRFVRTVVEGRLRVEFVYEGVLASPDELIDLLAVAVPALATVADDFFERMFLGTTAEA